MTTLYGLCRRAGLMAVFAVLVLAVLTAGTSTGQPFDPVDQTDACQVNEDAYCPFPLATTDCEDVECNLTAGNFVCPATSSAYTRDDQPYPSVRPAYQGEKGGKLKTIDGPVWPCQVAITCENAGKAGLNACSARGDEGKRFCLGGPGNFPTRVTNTQPTKRVGGDGCDAPPPGVN